MKGIAKSCDLVRDTSQVEVFNGNSTKTPGGGCRHALLHESDFLRGLGTIAMPNVASNRCVCSSFAR